jgi:hypothetical protein
MVDQMACKTSGTERPLETSRFKSKRTSSPRSRGWEPLRYLETESSQHTKNRQTISISPSTSWVNSHIWRLSEG